MNKKEQIAQRVAIAGPPQQRLTIGVLGLFEAALRLQRPRQHQPGFRRVPADGHGGATSDLGLGYSLIYEGAEAIHARIVCS